MCSKTSYSELYVLNRSIYSFCDGKVVVVMQIMKDCSVYVMQTFSCIQQGTNTVHRIHQFFKYIQGVTGGTDQTSGECSLGQTIPI